MVPIHVYWAMKNKALVNFKLVTSIWPPECIVAFSLKEIHLHMSVYAVSQCLPNIKLVCKVDRIERIRDNVLKKKWKKKSNALKFIISWYMIYKTLYIEAINCCCYHKLFLVFMSRLLRLHTIIRGFHNISWNPSIYECYGLMNNQNAKMRLDRNIFTFISW